MGDGMNGPVWHWVSGGLANEVEHDELLDVIRPFTRRPLVALRAMVNAYPLMWVTA